jgi:hypothetical protein
VGRQKCHGSQEGEKVEEVGYTLQKYAPGDPFFQLTPLPISPFIYELMNGLICG